MVMNPKKKRSFRDRFWRWMDNWMPFLGIAGFLGVWAAYVLLILSLIGVGIWGIVKIVSFVTTGQPG